MKQEFPTRFVRLKQQLVASDPDTQTRFTAAWLDLLKELAVATRLFQDQGSDVSSSQFHLPAGNSTSLLSASSANRI